MLRAMWHVCRPAVERVWKPALRALCVAAVLLAALPGAAPVRADSTQPYQPNEFVIHRAPGVQDRPIIGGSWVIWHDGASEVRKISFRNLANGQESILTTAEDYADYDTEGGLVVTAERNAAGQQGIFGYRLADGSRLTIAPMAGGAASFRLGPRISGSLVVWAEGSNAASGMDIYGHDLATNRTFPICADAAQQERPAVSGNTVVWADARHRGSSTQPVFDLYGYDLSTGREFRITRQPEYISAPAVSGRTVAWVAQRQGSYRLLAYDLGAGSETTLADLGADPGTVGLDIDGDLVVWNARPSYGDADVYGYDLKQKAQFAISRAVGDQLAPSISARTVVWTDTRLRTLDAADTNADVYGAALIPGPATIPPATGAPTAVDAKIQIVWPHNGAPVSQASLANVGSYLLQRGTMKPTPCQWRPKVMLWRAVTSAPARVVATATFNAGALTWEHNNVDVSPARDPQNKVFFFVTVEGTPTRSNVWAHAADARTFFPKADVPTGVEAASGAVDAKIEIVWPHGGLPVSQATLANITAYVFVPDTLKSVSSDWNGTVRLWRALNNGVASEVGIGSKRLVTAGGVTYPVWDFNNVDVSAARDAANKYYFYLTVDGVDAASNVWAHGTDARTVAPQRDTLDGGCS